MIAASIVQALGKCVKSVLYIACLLYTSPEACHRLMDTFNDSLDMADVLDAPTVSAQQFAAEIFIFFISRK